MLIITCPFCGPRDEVEFACGGEAHIARPLADNQISDADFADYLFMRDNPKGLFLERWRHSAGCRRWFNVARDTVSKIIGVETSRGFIKTKKVGCVVAGHSSVVAAMAGIRLPIASRPLQALVSEPIKPILDTVIMSNAVHMYISQSDKGEMVLGAGVDKYNSYAQRGSFPVPEHMLAAAVELFPVLSRLRMLRHWGGIVDTCPDASPIISKTDIEGLYFDCGWGTGGFKATPGSGHVFADLIANDRPNKIAAPYSLDRFRTGLLIDEHGAAGVAH